MHIWGNYVSARTISVISHHAIENSSHSSSHLDIFSRSSYHVLQVVLPLGPPPHHHIQACYFFAILVCQIPVWRVAEITHEDLNLLRALRDIQQLCTLECHSVKSFSSCLPCPKTEDHRASTTPFLWPAGPSLPSCCTGIGARGPRPALGTGLAAAAPCLSWCHRPRLQQNWAGFR